MLRAENNEMSRLRGILICILGLCFLAGCSKSDVDLHDKNYQESLINHYLVSLHEGKVEEALENVYFVKEDKESGYLERLEESMKTSFSYKEYEIKSIDEINENIYLAKVVIQSNTYSIDKSVYLDEEFNPYLCIIDKELRIVYSKDRIPDDLYSNIDDIPDNYGIEKEKLRVY